MGLGINTPTTNQRADYAYVQQCVKKLQEEGNFKFKSTNFLGNQRIWESDEHVLVVSHDVYGRARRVELRANNGVNTWKGAAKFLVDVSESGGFTTPLKPNAGDQCQVLYFKEGMEKAKPTNVCPVVKNNSVDLNQWKT